MPDTPETDANYYVKLVAEALISADMRSYPTAVWKSQEPAAESSTSRDATKETSHTIAQMIKKLEDILLGSVRPTNNSPVPAQSSAIPLHKIIENMNPTARAAVSKKILEMIKTQPALEIAYDQGRLPISGSMAGDAYLSELNAPVNHVSPRQRTNTEDASKIRTMWERLDATDPVTGRSGSPVDESVLTTLQQTEAALQSALHAVRAVSGGYKPPGLAALAQLQPTDTTASTSSQNSVTAQPYHLTTPATKSTRSRGGA